MKKKFCYLVNWLHHHALIHHHKAIFAILFLVEMIKNLGKLHGVQFEMTNQNILYPI